MTEFREGPRQTLSSAKRPLYETLEVGSQHDKAYLLISGRLGSEDRQDPCHGIAADKNPGIG